MNPESTLRQLLLYGAVGIAVIGCDWATMVALSGIGLPVPAANVIGRVAGALVGFGINGRHTFPQGTLPTQVQLARFWVAWIALTALSTLVVSAIAISVGEAPTGTGLESSSGVASGLAAAWIGKPLVDSAIAGLGFLVSKYWIYR